MTSASFEWCHDTREQVFKIMSSHGYFEEKFKTCLISLANMLPADDPALLSAGASGTSFTKMD